MANSRSLFERNAEACAMAKGHTCRCHCGGQFHGQAHPVEWRERMLIDLGLDDSYLVEAETSPGVWIAIGTPTNEISAAGIHGRINARKPSVKTRVRRIE